MRLDVSLDDLALNIGVRSSGSSARLGVLRGLLGLCLNFAVAWKGPLYIRLLLASGGRHTV